MVACDADCGIKAVLDGVLALVVAIVLALVVALVLALTCAEDVDFDFTKALTFVRDASRELQLAKASIKMDPRPNISSFLNIMDKEYSEITV